MGRGDSQPVVQTYWLAGITTLIRLSAEDRCARA